MRTCALILAAGRGTRMRSRLPKVLHAAGGRTLLGHVMTSVAGGGIAPADVAVVGGYGAEQIRAAIGGSGAHFVLQEPQLGTGHAVLAARDWWRGYDRVVVVHGDMPLLSAGTVAGLAAGRADAVLATATPAEPRAYGRILRDAQRPERVVGIVEDKQASAEQKRIRELNAGFYSFSTAALAPALEKLGTANPHGEYYLTDTIAILAGQGLEVSGLALEDSDECLGVNDRAELAQLDLYIRRRKAAALMANGVSIEYPESVVVDAAVEVGMDTVLEPGVQLRGASKVGENCRIRTGAVLENCELGDGVLVRPYSVLENARVGAGAQIGPFTRLREGAEIGEQAHIGNFVEVKKSRVGRGAKANHLAYIGDAQVGGRANIGAGTITCNYDGKAKHATRIGEGAFIGSNSTLVAPIEIGDGAYVAAGSVLTEAVPKDALGLGRARQVNKPEWAAKRRDQH